MITTASFEYRLHSLFSHLKLHAGSERSVCVVSVFSALKFSFQNQKKFLSPALSLSQGNGQVQLNKKQSPGHKSHKEYIMEDKIDGKKNGD